MNNLILSTKNTNKKLVKGRLFIAFLHIVSGFFGIFFYSFIVGDYYFKLSGINIFTWIVVIWFIACGLFQIYVSILSEASYLEIYDDIIKGAGIQSFRSIEFNMKFSDIHNITISGAFIYLHTTSGKYKIVSDFETAQKVLQYFNQ